MCHVISRSYVCGHIYNVEFMYCTKYRGMTPPRCCLGVGKPPADAMPQACKKCIEENMAKLKFGELTIMWDRCRRLRQIELEELEREEAENQGKK
ncbi:hypothetical protein AX17_006490 [Amanita inopinata Kibby_2008]|nr:hypothetical protein AX17_006490 [Amanita inopinata Kibby_2008]